MTDNTAHIEQMAAALATVASSPIATDDKARTKGSEHEDALVQHSAEAVVSTIAAVDEAASIDDGDDDPASGTGMAGEAVIAAGGPHGSVADTYSDTGDTPDPADIADAASPVIDSDLDSEGPGLPRRSSRHRPPPRRPTSSRASPPRPISRASSSCRCAIW